MTPEQALNVLYGNEERDLSGDGYQTALKKLRRKSPKLANQVERALGSTLETVLPRRAIKWHETSRGTTYRLALLHENLVFQRDAENVRKVFGLPATGVSPDRNQRYREVFKEPCEHYRDRGTE